MTTLALLVGIFAVFAGAVTLLILALSHRNKTRYSKPGGPELHPSWMHRDTKGTVYTSSNSRKG